jgi:hypothetical protein
MYMILQSLGNGLWLYIKLLNDYGDINLMMLEDVEPGQLVHPSNLHDETL